MVRYFIEVSYMGTRFNGFQEQENANGVQNEIQKAYQVVFRKPLQLTGSSRTDAGVHALQNYFHFDSDELDIPLVLYKLNALLPGDIAVKNIFPMCSTAHCRFDALSRSYQYTLHAFKNPFLSDRAAYYPYPLNKDLLNEGAIYIESLTNFFSFSKTNSQVTNYNCNIIKCSWQFQKEHFALHIEANRFLRGMVRLITGTLLKLGREKITLHEIEEAVKNQKRIGYSVPAKGLMLTSVNFPEKYFPVQH